MAADLERLAKEFTQNGHPEMGRHLQIDVDKARRAGVPESFPESGKRAEEVDLSTEWQNQAAKLASLFAGELVLTREQYIASLPKFEIQPKEYKGRLDIPVIVETRVPLKKMLKLAGITTYFDVDSIKDWVKGGFKTPDAPYATWLNDGSPNLGKSMKNVRKSLKADERGANIHDGIALYLRDPNIFDNNYLDLPGSQVGSEFAPYLIRWFWQPGLSRSLVGNEDPLYGSVVAGKIKA